MSGLPDVQPLEILFRKTYNLPEFDTANPYHYTRDKSLALDVMTLLGLTVKYSSVWSCMRAGVIRELSHANSATEAIFMAAIELYGCIPRAKLVYELLHPLAEFTDIVIITPTQLNYRYALYHIPPYEASGGQSDMREEFVDLYEAVTKLRVKHAKAISNFDDYYIYDRVTGLQYRIKD